MNVDRTDNCDDEDNRRLFEALSPNNASDKATQTEIIDGGSTQATARSSTQSEANEHWNAPNNPDTNSWRVFQPDETNYAIWHASGSNDETEEWAAALPSEMRPTMLLATVIANHYLTCMSVLNSHGTQADVIRWGQSGLLSVLVKAEVAGRASYVPRLTSKPCTMKDSLGKD